jgi:hypothetical protein
MMREYPPLVVRAVDQEEVMSRVRGSYYADEEFMRAAHEVVRDVEQSHGVTIVIELWPTYQRGVFTVRVASQETMERDIHLRHSTSLDFPNSRSMSLPATLYSCLLKLAMMLAEADASAKRQQSKLI